MKARVIACEVFYRELSLAVAQSENVLDLRFMPFGLHSRPSELRQRLQEEIARSDEREYDYVILGYGLCSRGTADLRAGAVPLVMPRAHDCITLLLGSRARYNKEFETHPGTYYYSSGWIERAVGYVRQGFIEEAREVKTRLRFEEYKAKYGEDNARYLIEQESLWMANYSRAVYIDTGLGAVEHYRRFVKGVASSRGWNYEEIAGDISLIRRLVAGNWNEDFLIVPAGAVVKESFDPDILCARSDSESSHDNTAPR